MVSADSMLPVITKARAVVVQVAVILQVVAFKMLRFLLSNGQYLVALVANYWRQNGGLKYLLCHIA